MTARIRWVPAVGICLLTILTGYARAAAQEPTPQAPPVPLFGGEPEKSAFDLAPRLQNLDEVRLALVREYPADLRSAGIEATVGLWLLLDEDGNLASARVRTSSAHPAMDAAALRLAARMRFAPARLKDAPVRVWVPAPVAFRLPPGSARSNPTPQTPRASARPGALALRPDMPPTEVAAPPELLNGPFVLAQLARAYAGRFADASAKGTTTLKLQIDANGNATGAEIGKGSGNPVLDSLALSITKTLVYAPALRGDRYAEGSAKLQLHFPPKD